MLTGYLLIWSAVLLVVLYLRKLQSIGKCVNIPTPPTTPILGNALMFMGKPEKVFVVIGNLMKQYERLVAIWMGPWLNIFLFDPKDVEVVLKASKNMEKAFQYNFLRPWLGDSILLSTGVKFRQNKKILVSTFSINNLKKYLPVFNDHAVTMVEKLKAEVGKDEFDIHGYLSLCTMHTLLESSLGVDKELLGKEALNYATAVERVGRCAHKRIYKLWLYSDFIFKFSSLKREQDKYLEVLNTLTERVISQRKTEYELRIARTRETGEDDKTRKSFVDTFFAATKENGDAFTQNEIKDEVMTMMFAGQDTTTVSVGFALSLLGVYKDIQDKVTAELDQIFENSLRPVTYEDILNMKYMEQVIQETWRLYPPIPVIAKTPSEDLPLDDFTVIPKNCTVAVAIMLLHRNPKVYPNPNFFNPDNFLPERIKERHPCSFIPFSSGYRTCIGPKYAMLLIKVVLATILRHYRVHSKRKMKEFVLAAQTTLKRKEGFLISLEPRAKNSWLNIAEG